MAEAVADLRVLVVADDPLARAGLAMLLSGQPGCTVAGQISSEVDLPALLEVYRPDGAVWDLGWDPLATAPAAAGPDDWPAARTGLERLSDFTETGLPIVALLPDETLAGETWNTGVHNLLLRQSGPEKLLAALLAAVQGLVSLDPVLATALLPARGLALPALVETLTPRELEVLQLLAEGLPNKGIARRLDISEHTVKFHVNAILGKLGVQSRTEAVVQATRLGLVLL